MTRSCGKHLLPLVAAASTLSAFAILVVLCQSSPTGFINIDCGKPKYHIYTDRITGLDYTSDFQYVNSGEIHKVDALTVEGPRAYEQAYDLRSFPHGKRNCFMVKQIQKGGRYLVRTSFMYGNYDEKNSAPKFDLYLGVNFWRKIYLPSPTENYIHEIVTVITSDQISVCLVNTGQGVPFMSVLELRLLPPDLYDQHATTTQALVHYSRKNYGGDDLRYPSDPYDILWIGDSGKDWKTLSSTSPVDNAEDEYQPPSDVMKTASYPSAGSLMKLSWPLGISNPRFYVILHFAELRRLKGNETRNFGIVLNGDVLAHRVDLSYLKAGRVVTENPTTMLNFYLSGKRESTLPPIINAAEVYIISDATGPETNSDDVDAITAIKAAYKVPRNWSGDPCSPPEFAWDGLRCHKEEGSTNSYRIVSLNLSSSGLTGEISTSFAGLSQLQYLNLSGNELTGGVPDVLASLTHLKNLDLSGNRLNGYVPSKLLERSAEGILTLRIDSKSESTSSSGQMSIWKIIQIIGVITGSAGIVFGGWKLYNIRTGGSQESNSWCTHAQCCNCVFGKG